MACVCEVNADHAVDAGQHRPSRPWRLRNFLIQRVYRRAMACCNEADVVHAVVAGLHRLAGRKNVIQRVYRRAMASFSEPGRVRAVDACQHRPSRHFLDLADQGKRYSEGISTGDGLQARGPRRFCGPWRLKKFLIQRVYRRALACCHEATDRLGQHALRGVPARLLLGQGYHIIRIMWASRGLGTQDQSAAVVLTE